MFSRVQQSISINRENAIAKVRRNHSRYLIFNQVRALLLPPTIKKLMNHTTTRWLFDSVIV
jgi:hypothetical protein